MFASRSFLPSISTSFHHPGFCPLFFSLLFSVAYCGFLVSVFTCLGWHIRHFFQKKSKALQVFFVITKETEELSLMERTYSSLLRNNSHVSCSFYLFHVLVYREGLSSMECSSVHLCMCVYLKRVNGKLAFIPGFVCMGTLQNVCKFWGVSDQGLSFNTVLRGSQLNWTYKFMEIRVARGSSGCRRCVKVQDCIPSSG